MTEYNKLVRDRIPEIIQQEGRTAITEIMGQGEYLEALRLKLVEEAQEAAQSLPEADLIKELADVYEVIDALLAAYQIDRDAVLSTQQKRRDQRGGFQNRIRLVSTE
jgi:predicted house-cleaning noncanonical NTP pyrophosphatase (MazG superfamily)